MAHINIKKNYFKDKINKMKKRLVISISLLFWGFAFANAGTIKVVTTTTDLKSITELIGGNKVSVSSIATGYQNPHFVDPKPSYIINLSNADMFVTLGLDLEIGWSPQLLASSRNTKIQKGSAGYVDASQGIGLYQVPTSANRGEGDIHIFGNPHYWLDPLNGKVIARNIANGLERIDPSDKAMYENNLQAFFNNIDIKMREWQAEMAPFKGSKVIAYHNEWVYFETRFGLKIVDFMEPKPGIPPTPSQLVKVIGEVKANNIKVIISSPYFSTSSSDVVAKQTGIKVLTMATSVGAFPSIKNYFDLFDYDIKQLSAVLK
ncbi:zinc ABC transporter substrate-binding protein [Ginsengibacter hankyongi]|uniref:Zinc ABC transporter substrate-binding protein n=2 Tax=Ginsengibacter hankyongi TaxID=2607284 RepID=A0A5J5IQ25_9BACT|nr:zinc ABC transporter substrate-binding protein [Ginsengibacter hankyongi]